MFTYLWYDFETYGADPKRDRISQFAGIRTNENFEIIEEYELFCKIADDYLPNPEACLITGITPNEANLKGVSEEELSKELFSIFTKANTVSVGYNSFKFDDEVLRHLFYRTFRNPYKREWADGCSRWDFLRVVMGFYIKNPNSIIYPKDDSGKVSFKLEYLSKINGISHENAHDALSDVRATIALAKLMHDNDKNLYDYIFNLRQKSEVVKLMNRGKYFIHGDFTYGIEKGYKSLLYKLDYSFKKDEYIFLDLESDLDILYKEDVLDLKKFAYMKNEELEALGKTRPGIKIIKSNSLPLLFSETDVSNYAKEISKAKYIEIRLRDKLSEFVKYEKNDNLLDIEIDPYNNFFSYDDEKNFSQMRETIASFTFQTQKWQELFKRFKAKNFQEILSEKELLLWQTSCYKWLKGFEKREGFLTFDSLNEKISSLLENESNDKNLLILNKLAQYSKEQEEKINNFKIISQEQQLFETENNITEKTEKPKKIKKTKEKNQDSIVPLKLF